MEPKTGVYDVAAELVVVAVDRAALFLRGSFKLRGRV